MMFNMTVENFINKIRSYLLRENQLMRMQDMTLRYPRTIVAVYNFNSAFNINFYFECTIIHVSL